MPELDDPKVRELLLIRHNPSSAEARPSLGQVLQQKKDAAGAAAAFAISAGRENLAQGDVEAALARLRDAVRLAQFQLVLALQRKGTAAEARSHLDTARRLAPWLAPPGSEP